MSSFDAILIPGGGLTVDGAPHPWVEARLAHVLEIGGDAPLICLSGFTPHKPPPIDTAGFPIFESVASARWLLKRGVESDRIYTEACSCDTIGNAYFARTIHTDPRGWRNILIVTSEFHLPRTNAIFKHVFEDLTSAAEPATPYRLEFQAAPNIGITSRDLAARAEKERKQLELWNNHINSGQITTLAELHRWIYSQHDCYATGREPLRITGAALTTY